VKYYDLLCKGKPAKGLEASSAKVEFCKGGSLEQNRKIVRKKCDVLLNPVAIGKQSVDSALLQIAKDNNVTIGISFRQFLECEGNRRAKLISIYQKLVALCLKKGNRILIVSGAETEMEKRQPMQLAALGMLLGLSASQAKWCISKVPEYLIKKVGK